MTHEMKARGVVSTQSVTVLVIATLGLAVAVALASMLFAASCAPYNTFPKGQSAGLGEPAALKALIDSGQTVHSGDYRIVDVRSRGEYAKGHIPTATNLPDGNLETRSARPPKDKLIIVYCGSGGGAQQAAERMGEIGYGHVFNWGGFASWTYAVER